jgi:hypothetical protein
MISYGFSYTHNNFISSETADPDCSVQISKLGF